MEQSVVCWCNQIEVHEQLDWTSPSVPELSAQCLATTFFVFVLVLFLCSFLKKSYKKNNTMCGNMTFINYDNTLAVGQVLSDKDSSRSSYRYVLLCVCRTKRRSAWRSGRRKRANARRATATATSSPLWPCRPPRYARPATRASRPRRRSAAPVSLSISHTRTLKTLVS